MEGGGMVIDTGLFIEFLRAKNKTKTILYNLPEEAEFFISSVTLYELIMGATTKEKMSDIEILTGDLVVLPFDHLVSVKAAEIYHKLRKSNKMIEFRDIFIAATCIVNGLAIKMLNKKHFERVNDLQII